MAGWISFVESRIMVLFAGGPKFQETITGMHEAYTESME